MGYRPGDWRKPRNITKIRPTVVYSRASKDAKTKTGIDYPLIYEYDLDTGEVYRSWRVWDEDREAALPLDFIRFGSRWRRDDNPTVEGRLQFDSAGRLYEYSIHREISDEGRLRQKVRAALRTSAIVQPVFVSATRRLPSSAWISFGFERYCSHCGLSAHKGVRGPLSTRLFSISSPD